MQAAKARHSRIFHTKFLVRELEKNWVFVQNFWNEARKKLIEDAA